MKLCLQAPHPLLRNPHSITGACVPRTSACNAGIHIPHLPSSSLKSSLIKTEMKQSSGGASLSTSKNSKGNSVRNDTADKQGSDPCKHGAKAGVEDVGERIQRAASLPKPQKVLDSTDPHPSRQRSPQDSLREQNHSKIVLPTGTSKPDTECLASDGWDTCIIDTTLKEGAEEWHRCSSIPPADSTLSALRERASCESLGLDTVQAVSEKPSAKKAELQPSTAPTSHCAVVLSTLVSGNRLGAASSQVSILMRYMLIIVLALYYTSEGYDPGGGLSHPPLVDQCLTLIIGIC